MMKEKGRENAFNHNFLSFENDQKVQKLVKSAKKCKKVKKSFHLFPMVSNGFQLFRKASFLFFCFLIDFPMMTNQKKIYF